MGGPLFRNAEPDEKIIFHCRAHVIFSGDRKLKWEPHGPE